MVKCISFESLLSPCAWLVKWHNCKSVNDSVSDITEEFSLFCNFSASRSITTPVVYFGLLLLLLLLMLKLWYYWTAELLNIVKNWINWLWNKVLVVQLSVSLVAANRNTIMRRLRIFEQLPQWCYIYFRELEWCHKLSMWCHEGNHLK